MVLDDLLDLALQIGGDVTSGNLLEESSLRCGEVSTEVSFPFGDLVDGDGVKLMDGKMTSALKTRQKERLHVRDR